MRKVLRLVYNLLPHPKQLTPVKKVLLTIYYLLCFFFLFGYLPFGIFLLALGYVIQSLSEFSEYARINKYLAKTIKTFVVSFLALFVSLSVLINSQPQTVNSPNTNVKTSALFSSLQSPVTKAVYNENTFSESHRTKQLANTTVPTATYKKESGKPVQPFPINFTKVFVTKVIDGDTIVVRLPSGKEEKVRFIGVNAPESTDRLEPYGVQASLFTEESLSNKYVYLEKDISERDKYGRLLRYIWLSPPAQINESEIRQKLFNAILVLEGYAQVATYPPDVKYTEYFLKFQREAQQKGKGLWYYQELFQTTTTKSQQYVGNTNSKKFHYPWCKWAQKISPYNRVYFQSRKEAIKAGYIPCKVCKP
ncbi:thermonuclease family protein [Caldicellulosiruptor naganoensis]|uniref:Thermonuclease family protein n=1 Tax=Caldicellulosiruptor naganoensis TaxID=29324 RepID=A0ABY7BK58_9FIRM|nr:thermonuclease family protein [Caldicellulosiruptor naganoensis]WAM32456.1 thermonuclease family protein [Caldicellulosiruptor naganoensis]